MPQPTWSDPDVTYADPHVTWGGATVDYNPLGNCVPAAADLPDCGLGVVLVDAGYAPTGNCVTGAAPLPVCGGT